MPKIPRPGPPSRPAPPGERTNDRDGSNGAGAVAKEAGTDVVGWVDERTGATGFLTGMLYRKVPKGTNWFYTLGSATLFAFTFQALTGVFLAMYYTPSPTEAYGSITHLTNDVWMGEFVRGMHKWGASVMIIVIFLHMGRVFFFGAYKYPRELNWVIGVVLLILTLVMGLTGYLLPFDQRSYWATIVANNITGTGPDRRALPGGLPARRPRDRGDHAVALLRDPHAPRAGVDHRPDRRAPLSRRQARDHGAAVAPRRAAQVAAQGGSRDEQGREGGYLRDYEVLKKKGKPFFPYAVLKDSAMALIVVARDHRDVDPPRCRAGPQGRPDHHHLHAAARVVLLLPLRAAAGDQAALGRPRSRRSASRPSAMVLLLLLPFYDRNAGATTGAPADRHYGRDPDDHRDGLPDLPRRHRRPADRDRSEDFAPHYEAGKEVVAQSGCLACHKLGENGNNGPGPELTHIGAPPAQRTRSCARWRSGPSIMPSYSGLPPQKFQALTAYLASLN